MRLYVDFARVKPEHAEIHRRLENWARWLRPGQIRAVCPYLRLYRPTAQEREPYIVEARAPTSAADAMLIQRAIQDLPQDKRIAISWCYYSHRAPHRQARQMGLSITELYALVTDSREMLLGKLPRK